MTNTIHRPPAMTMTITNTCTKAKTHKVPRRIEEFVFVYRLNLAQDTQCPLEDKDKDRDQDKDRMLKRLSIC